MYSDEVVPMASQNLDEGRTCAVCAGAEFETRTGTAVCQVREHVPECRCDDGEVLARGVQVEIESFLPFAQTHLLDASCSECGEVGEGRANVTLKQTEATRTATFGRGESPDIA